MVDSVEPPPNVAAEAMFKAQALQQIEAAKAGGSENFLKKIIDAIRVKASFALAKLKEKFKKVESGEDKDALSKSPDGSITDEASEKHAQTITKIHVSEIIKTYKTDPALIPIESSSTSGKVLRKLVSAIENPDLLSDASATYVYKIIDRATHNEITNPLEILDAVELKQLTILNAEIGKKVADIAQNLAKEQGLSDESIKEWKDKIKPQDAAPPQKPPNEPPSPPAAEQQPVPKKPNGEEEVRKRIFSDAERKNVGTREYHALLERFPEGQDQSILRALFNREYFDEHVGDVTEWAFDKYKKKNPQITAANFDELPDMARDIVGKDVSEKLVTEIRLLMGKLFRAVDESTPEEFWEEAAKMGSLFTNTEVLSQILLEHVEKLRFEQYDRTSNVGKLPFFKDTGLSEDIRIETETRHPTKETGEKAKGVESRRFVTPFYNREKVAFKDFFLAAYNGAKDEIGVRKYLHNATALFYQPKPEGGYYRQMERYAEQLLPATSVDVLATLPDSDVVYTASQLEDKLLEADFAKFNWIHTPTLSQLDSDLKMTDRSQKVLEYLKQLYPDLQSDDWRYKRALVMGIGDNHSISLKALEHGARADAPRMLDGGHGYSEDHTSYDKKDHLPFMAMNPFNHYNLRYGMDRTLAGNLMFLPVDGSLMGDSTKWWDHNSLMDEMKSSINSYVTGREQDMDDKTRLIDFTNLGKVGSIYTRGGWRKFHAYEGFHVGKGGHHNVLATWQNIENIGVEVLQDYAGRIGKLDPHFYGHDATSRRKLVEHIHGRYFKNSKQTVDQVFAELEGKVKGEVDHERIERVLADEYQTYYFKAMTRAIVQRIPTKFLRYERNREVVKRKRAWDVVREQVGIEAEPYQQAIRDLCAVEVKERAIVSLDMKKRINSFRNENDDLTVDGSSRMYETLADRDIDYEVTETKVREYMKKMNITDESRVENAVKVLKGVHTFTQQAEDGKYLDKFAIKFKEGKFPFAIAVEELERSLLAQRASGERTIARAMQDIANIEDKVSNTFADYWVKLKTVSVDGKKDFHSLVHDIEVAKEQLEVDVGPPHAEKIAHHMAAVTIAYFKKDTVGRNIFTRALLLGAGRKYSIAAEFAGTNRGVWEWEVNDIANFINTLEAQSVLPKDANEAGMPVEYETKNMEIKVPFRKEPITLPFKTKQIVQERKWYGGKLREDFGATNSHIAVEFANKYLPIIAGVALFMYIKEAMEEASGKD